MFSVILTLRLLPLTEHASLEASNPELRFKIIEADCGRREVANLARMAVEETGLGRYDDKINKNLLVGNKTPGPEILKPVAVSGDNGLMLTERAAYGVIERSPTTNPTETIICNGIGMLSGGNAVVFNVHRAKTFVFLVDKINQAIVAAGGPDNLICSIEANIQSAQALMTHAGIRLLVVTGGPES